MKLRYVFLMVGAFFALAFIFCVVLAVLAARPSNNTGFAAKMDELKSLSKRIVEANTNQPIKESDRTYYGDPCPRSFLEDVGNDPNGNIASYSLEVSFETAHEASELLEDLLDDFDEEGFEGGEVEPRDYETSINRRAILNKPSDGLDVNIYSYDYSPRGENSSLLTFTIRDDTCYSDADAYYEYQPL